MVFKDKGISILISIKNFVSPKLDPASLNPLPTCLIPKFVNRIIGGKANIIVATTPGVNQTLMLALSMVVLAALIGAGGLGLTVYIALGRLDVGSAVIGGTGIVILAIILDRITQKIIKSH